MLVSEHSKQDVSDDACGNIVRQIGKYQHRDKQGGAVVQDFTKDNKRELLSLDTDSQAQAAEPVHTRFGAGEKAGKQY